MKQISKNLDHTSGLSKNKSQQKRYEKLYELSKIKQEAIEIIKNQTISKEEKELMHCTF